MSHSSRRAPERGGAAAASAGGGASEPAAAPLRGSATLCLSSSRVVIPASPTPSLSEGRGPSPPPPPHVRRPMNAATRAAKAHPLSLRRRPADRGSAAGPPGATRRAATAAARSKRFSRSPSARPGEELALSPAPEYGVKGVATPSPPPSLLSRGVRAEMGSAAEDTSRRRLGPAWPSPWSTGGGKGSGGAAALLLEAAAAPGATAKSAAGTAARALFPSHSPARARKMGRAPMWMAARKATREYCRGPQMWRQMTCRG